MRRIEKGICGICPTNCGIGIEFKNGLFAKMYQCKEYNC